MLAPEPHETTASILVLLHGGGFATDTPFFSVVTNVFDLELNKSHRTTLQGLTTGVGIKLTGVMTGTFQGTFVGGLMGAFAGAATGTNVTNILKRDVTSIAGATTL